MDNNARDVAPTSSATTAETEPEVVAAVASAEGGPDLPTAIRIGGLALGFGRAAMLLAGGMALGYGAARLLRGRS